MQNKCCYSLLVIIITTLNKLVIKLHILILVFKIIYQISKPSLSIGLIAGIQLLNIQLVVLTELAIPIDHLCQLCWIIDFIHIYDFTLLFCVTDLYAHSATRNRVACAVEMLDPVWVEDAEGKAWVRINLLGLLLQMGLFLYFLKLRE